MQFLPGDLAQLQSDEEKQRERQRRAQQLMQAGFNPAPNANPILAILGSVMSTVKGNSEFKDAEGKLSENLRKRFDAENQAAQAKAEQERARRLEDRQWGREDKEFSAQTEAKYRAPKEQSFEEKLFGMLPENMRGQAALGKFGLGPKAGPGPSESDRKIAQLRQLGATDDQIRSMLLGNQGGNAPSGYRPKADGSLEPIPGGPADKPKELDPKAAAAAQVRSLLGQIEGNKESGGPLDQYWPGEGQAKFQGTVDQLTNPFQTLTRVPGSGANSDFDAKLLQASLPKLGDREEVTQQKVNNLRQYLTLLEQGKGLGEGSPLNQPQAAPQQQTAPQGQPTQTATGPNGQRIGLVNGQWVPI